MPNHTLPIGDPAKTCTIPFDRQLSLALDAIHDELDSLSCQRGLRAWWWRFLLRRQLRKLEARIPR